jgi:hypothetical protein
MFRDPKQVARLAACQGWVDQAMVRHVALVCLTFVALQLLRRDPQETVGAVKARWLGSALLGWRKPWKHLLDVEAVLPTVAESYT